jgi:hypothetical protein
MPVVLLPGSSLMRSGCNAQESTVRSTSRITNGKTRCTRARPRSRSSLARFSVHGITGLPCRSSTKTGTPSPVKNRALTGLVTSPCGDLPSTMLQRSFGIAPLRQTVSCLPYACLHLPLSEPGTKEAFRGESSTSLQRSGLVTASSGQPSLSVSFQAPAFRPG